MRTNELLLKLRNGDELNLQNQLLLILKLSFPSIVAQLSSIIMSFIDASMVGHLGSSQAASIGLVASSTWLILGLTFASSMGFTVQCAQLIGAKKEKEARNLVKNALFVTSFFSLALMIICIAISFHLPLWLGASSEIYHDAWIYFFVFALSVPIVQMNDLSAEMLQCAGEMKIPSISQIFMAVLNIALNYVLIFVCKMGVFGAALSTLIARFSVTIFLLFFLLKKSILKFEKTEKFTFDKEIFIKAAKISAPIAFENVIMSGGQIAYSKITAPLGTASLAANSFGITVESLCYMPAHGIGAAASTLCGQSFGAGRKNLTYRFGWLTTISGMVLMIFTGAAMFFFGREMISLLSPDAEIIALGDKILKIEAFCEPFYGASLVANGALRGTGDTFVPSLFKFGSVWLIRIPLALLLVGKLGLNGIWIAMSFELCIRGILFLIRLAGKKWVQK